MQQGWNSKQQIINIVEYEGLILGLYKTKALDAKIVLAKTDSQVVAG